jgi:hypothetical protein
LQHLHYSSSPGSLFPLMARVKNWYRHCHWIANLLGCQELLYLKCIDTRQWREFPTPHTRLNLYLSSSRN